MLFRSVSSGFQENPDGAVSPLQTSRGNSAEYPRHPPNGGSSTAPRAGQEFDVLASNRGQPDGYWTEKPQAPGSQTDGYTAGYAGDVGPQQNPGIRNTVAPEHSLYGNGGFMVNRGDGNALPSAAEHQRRMQLQDEPIRAGFQQNAGLPNGQGDWAYGGVPAVGGSNGTSEEAMRGMHPSMPRPGGGPHRNDTTPTISHLHVPGEYPKSGGAGFI